MTERNEADKRVSGEVSSEESEKREARKRRRADKMRRMLSQVPVIPVWAPQPVFEIVTGIRRRHGYELAAAGIVRTKKDGAATRWSVVDGLKYLESRPAANIHHSPAQRKKMAKKEAKADQLAPALDQKSTA